MAKDTTMSAMGMSTTYLLTVAVAAATQTPMREADADTLRDITAAVDRVRGV